MRQHYTSSSQLTLQNFEIKQLKCNTSTASTSNRYGISCKNHDDKEVAILAKSMQNTTKVDMRALDANKNVILDWKKIDTYAYWQNWSIDPVDGTVIQKGSSIDMQLRDHYDHKNTSYITDGELDYQ